MTAWRIRVRGQVQGVGFRPYVWQLAHAMGLRGDVLNDPEGVLIHVTGGDLAAFVARLGAEVPPLARIDRIETGDFRFAEDPEDFVIAPSRGAGAETRVTPDAATCAACTEEIRDPRERRFGYAFANCTHCGPRFTILQGLPYDRAKTAMAAFAMCPACAAEYADPADRRFHAQPIACPNCGPRLWMEAGGQEIAGDPIALSATLLRAGGILAVKGLGGFHLACDATNGDAVATLRHRKRRPAKPLALMGTPEMIRVHSRVSDGEFGLLADPAAPIVLLDKAGDPLPEALAPGQGTLGWMLPYTPLHHLLLDATGRPLVMTSGNLSGEPQAIGNDEAREKLSGFADGFLMHDRDIVRRLDDSVERVTATGPMVLRRARGRVPGTLALPPGFDGAPQVIAYGGQLKSAICLTKGGAALLSHHLGDLDDALTWDEFQKAERDYAALFDHSADVVACDLHPGYRASLHAVAVAGSRLLVQVQHHHAHLAACLGENGWPLDGGPVAGIILDGLGYGEDGTIWGGEILTGDYRGFTRASWLRAAPLPGGELAQREPWRNLLVRLDQAGLGAVADEILAGKPLPTLRRAAAAGVNSPLSSSAGRLFDAVAAACGILGGQQTFEGEAAMRLEAACVAGGFDAPYAFGTDGSVIDPAPMFREWAEDRSRGTPAGRVAARFHAGLARSFAERARAEVEAGRAQAVALSGGCFQNVTLLAAASDALKGLTVLVHRKVPANDGGLALGQALVAGARAIER